MDKLKTIGSKLYIQFKGGNFVGNYAVSRKFIDGLSDSETQELIEGFIDERKKHCNPVDTEEEQIETFWAMYNETV